MSLKKKIEKIALKDACNVRNVHSDQSLLGETSSKHLFWLPFPRKTSLGEHPNAQTEVRFL